MNRENVLLVGGTGFLGSCLSTLLKERGYIVHITGREERREKNYFCIDFSDRATFCNIDKNRFNYIFILAASLEGIGSNSLDKDIINTNTVLYADFLEYLSKEHKHSKIIYISSMTVYNPENKVPVKETYLTSLPPNTYGLTKRIGEDFTSFFCDKKAVKGLILRIPGLFGKVKKNGFIYQATKRMLEGKSLEINTEGLVYWESALVDDIAQMILELIENYTWDKSWDIFNLGYGENNDIIKVAEIIKEKLNSDSEIREIFPKGYIPFYLCNEKVKRIIKFDYSFEKAIDKYIRNFIG